MPYTSSRIGSLVYMVYPDAFSEPKAPERTTLAEGMRRAFDVVSLRHS